MVHLFCRALPAGESTNKYIHTYNFWRVTVYDNAFVVLMMGSENLLSYVCIAVVVVVVVVRMMMVMTIIVYSIIIYSR